MTTRQNGLWKGFLLVLLLTGCAIQVPRIDTRGVAPDEAGPIVAQHLQDRYDQNWTECRPSYTPAVLCSGVLMRVTVWSTGYHSWIPNPATSAGGVSFSWLRQDANFTTAFGSNGFVAYPHYFSDTPDFYQLAVNCGYVSNAGTGSLADKCRIPCHAVGVTTSTQWLAKYASGYGCAFKIAPGDTAPDPAEAWMAMVEVRRARNISSWNEVIVATWPQNTFANMPLEAFFYLNGNASGRVGAQNDQKDFKITAGRWVPVINLTLATTVNGRATFTYSATDQAILN